MKSKKMYKSIVAIALVCVMLVMCMGAGYSVKVAKETTNVEFTIYQNEEGMFTHENEMGILKKVFSSNKVFVREAEEFDDIYVDNNGKYYHKIQDSEFAAVEKLSYNLNASDTLARLNSTDLPEEILQDIEEVSLWIKKEM